MNQNFQHSRHKMMTLFFALSLLMTGCDTPKRSLPSFAGKPRFKINPELSQTPKRPLNPFVNLDSDLTTPDNISKEGQ